MPWLHEPISVSEVSSELLGRGTNDTDDTSDEASEFLVGGFDGRFLVERQKTSADEIGKK